MNFYPPPIFKSLILLTVIALSGGFIHAQLSINSSGDATFTKKAYFNQTAYLKNVYITSDFYIKPSASSYPTFFLKNSNGYIGISKGPSSPSYVLDVGGTMRVVSTLYYSDENVKKDVRSLPSERISDLYSLNAKVFKYDYDKLKADSKETDGIKNKDHFGLLAQDIEKVYPELVYEDSLGTLSVDYIGLIPILLESVKSLHNEIASLKNLKSASAEESLFITDDISDLQENYLGKNKPNPFNEETLVAYYLAPTTDKAFLYIYDLQGKQLKSLPVHQFENGQIRISGSELQAGMYYYTLVADGKVVGMEQMILTK